MNKKPGFFYGYVVVAASFIIAMAGWGTYYSYGLFFDSLLNEFGWTRAMTSVAFALSTFLSGFVGIITGRLSDRVGPKAITILCGVCFGVGYLLMSLAHALWQVYLIWGLVLAIGIGGLWAPMISTIARWFVKRRGLMTGIVASGMGIGSIILSPVISQLIQAYGWRAAYISISIIALVAIVVPAQFLKRDPRQIGLAPYGEIITGPASMPPSRDFTFQQAIRTHQFWLVCVIYFLFGYNQPTIMVHIVPYATGLGISLLDAAGIIAIIGASSVIGRIITGGASDRIRAKSSLLGSLILLLFSLTWLEFADSLPALYIFSIAFGFAWGGMSSLQMLTAAELFGLKALGIIVGVFSFCFCLGGLFGPTITGYLFDLSGSYQQAFLICAITSLTALISVLWLPRLKRATHCL